MKQQEQQPTNTVQSWYEQYQLERATAILKDQIEAEKSGSTIPPVVSKTSGATKTERE
jgi:hypothetical protein